MNRIEPVLDLLKRHEMSTRNFTRKADLRKAVDDGFETAGVGHHVALSVMGADARRTVVRCERRSAKRV